MGNICSKSANKPSEDNFTGPGRRLGGAASSASPPTANRTTQPIPSTVQATSSSPGRTLGAGVENDPEDARAQAARAAQARLDQKNKSSSSGGKLATQLRASQGKTVNDTLNEISRQNRDERRADENATTQAWN